MKYFLCLIFLATSVAGDFGNDFYQLLAKDNPNSNIISSPLALEIALKMLYLGAKDKTAQELRVAINAPEDKTHMSAKYDAFFHVLKARQSAVSMDIANSIYINDKLNVVPTASKYLEPFNSQAVGLNVAAPDKAAATVNSWVKAQTHNRITSALTAKDIDASLKILLLNVFAFKGNWLFRWTKRTRNEPFQTSAGKTVSVKMMQQYGFYKAAELPDLDAKVLQLRYHKSSLSLYVFLPNKPDGLAALEAKLGGYVHQNLTSRQVHIKLPKFKIEFSTELSKILKQLKIVDAFGDSANMQDLVKEANTGISKVIHKGSLEINEDGAGIASIIGIRDSFVKNSALPSAMNFKANHPFAYVIRDDRAIYFQGHIVNPQ